MSYKKKPPDKERLPPFVPLLISTLESSAWRAMSHGAARLYIALRKEYRPKNHNNGKIYLSQRKAHHELRSHHTEIARWFRELQHFGMIVMMSEGTLGLDGKGKAPHWRLTELGTVAADGTLDLPTCDFLKWDGTPFRDTQKRTRKQNPVPEIPHITSNNHLHSISPVQPKTGRRPRLPAASGGSIAKGREAKGRRPKASLYWLPSHRKSVLASTTPSPKQ